MTRLSLPVAIVLAAVMICATLVALNLRVTYPTEGMNSQAYGHLLASGCNGTGYLPGGMPGVAPVAMALSCPLWVRP
jgi:hypothetical protein